MAKKVKVILPRFCEDTKRFRRGFLYFKAYGNAGERQEFWYEKDPDRQ